jgi:hypothetical protein
MDYRSDRASSAEGPFAGVDADAEGRYVGFEPIAMTADEVRDPRRPTTVTLRKSWALTAPPDILCHVAKRPSANVVVFGDPKDLRAAIKQRLKAAPRLMARVSAARVEIDALPPEIREMGGLAGTFARLNAAKPLAEVERSIRTWLLNNVRALRPYLASAADQFDVKYDPGDDGTADALDGRLTSAEQAVRDGVFLLEGLLAHVAARQPARLRDPDERFAELREAGLIEDAALRPMLRRMSKMRTPAQISAAIAASKEIVEACNRATCELLDLEAPTSGNFPKLGKTVRDELVRRDAGATTQKATEAVQQLFSGMASIELGLASLRNELGEGHGRPKAPKLRPRHGQLAVDAADMHVRYLLGTLRDLDLL